MVSAGRADRIPRWIQTELKGSSATSWAAATRLEAAKGGRDPLGRAAGGEGFRERMAKTIPGASFNLKPSDGERMAPPRS